MIHIYRFGVLGSFFQVTLLSLSTVLAYFDLRSSNLVLHAFYLSASITLTLVTLSMGFPYYGLGYLLAGGFGLVAGYLILFARLADLPYLTFVGNNPSVR